MPTRRIAIISNEVAEGVEGGQAILVLGLAGHPVEDVTLDNIRIEFEGGGTAAQAARAVPEMERDYPEPGSFGTTQSISRRMRDKMMANGKLRMISGRPLDEGALDAVAQVAMRNSLHRVP